MKTLLKALLAALLPLAFCLPAHAQGPKTFDVTQAPHEPGSTHAGAHRELTMHD